MTMAKPNVALQLYTVREACARDFKGTLKRLAEIGYKNVELAGLHGLAPEELKYTLDALGLRAVSAHESQDALTQDLDGVLSRMKAMGVEYIVCPGAAATHETDPAAWDHLAEQFETVGRGCRDAGLVFAYHNHAHEFQMVDGRYGLDYLMEKTSPDLVRLEVDAGWVWFAGVDPAAYLRKYPGRAPLIHAKDHDREDKNLNRPVGDGAVDWNAVFAAAREIGVQYAIVEEDKTILPELESVEKSLQNLKAMGLE